MIRDLRTVPAHREQVERPALLLFPATPGRSGRRVFSFLCLLFTSLTLVFLAVTAGDAAAGTAGLSISSYVPLVNYEPLLEELVLRPVLGGIGNDTVVAITHAGDERLFVGTQAGVIYVVQREGGDFTDMSIFLDLRGKVNLSFEEGLLGLAFDPHYAATGYFYTTYNEFGTGRIILARYTVSPDPNVADPDSRSVLISLDKPLNPPGEEPGYSPVHNAGDMHFGPDNYLYVAIGDGGPDPYVLPIVPGDPDNLAQRKDVLFGKILRLDPSGQSPYPPQCGGTGYTIPADNPFTDSFGCDEIWSLGFRNPWRFSFDALTGEMYIADVGEWLLEEINREPAGIGGRNYGWHCFEGTYDHRNAPHLWGQCPLPFEEYTFPLHIIDRTQGCSVIGGYVYRASAQSMLKGHYFFSDFCSRKIWTIHTADPSNTVRELDVSIVPGNGLPQWTAFGQDVNGEIYIGAFLHDAVYHLTQP